jgi:hypothetical protein
MFALFNHFLKYPLQFLINFIHCILQMDIKIEENEILKYVIAIIIDRTTVLTLNFLRLGRDRKTLLKMWTLQ